MIKDDYARTGIPMLPVVRGEAYTKNQILLYAIVLLAVSLGPVATGLLGGIYLASAVALGVAFVAFAALLQRRAGDRMALRTYLFSLAYLALLFIAMAVDAIA